MTGDENNLHFRLGQIDGRLLAIERRLDEGSKRHVDLDTADEALKERVVKLELIEAKRGGVLAAIAAMGSLAGGLIAIAINYLLRKL